MRRILDATVALLAREGVESLTTNRVAEEAGLSVASLYRFFPNKQAVIYAAYGEWIEELAMRVSEIVAQWRAPLAAAPAQWPRAASEIMDVLGESRRGARAEYELLRAMVSHRELRARDETYTRALAANVAELMRLAGARTSDEQLELMAAFANEQFTLAAEFAGHRIARKRVVVDGLARTAFLALWRQAIEADE